MKFNSGAEMLKVILDGTDLYNPEKETYVFVYNDAGSIAYYSIDEITADRLADEAEEYGDYWSGFLGIGGYIADDPSYDFFKEGDYSNLDWCNDNYSGEWIDTKDYGK